MEDTIRHFNAVIVACGLLYTVLCISGNSMYEAPGAFYVNAQTMRFNGFMPVAVNGIEYSRISEGLQHVTGLNIAQSYQERTSPMPMSFTCSVQFLLQWVQALPWVSRASRETWCVLLQGDQLEQALQGLDDIRQGRVYSLHDAFLTADEEAPF
jgi:hypothetical protein